MAIIHYLLIFIYVGLLNREGTLNRDGHTEFQWVDAEVRWKHCDAILLIYTPKTDGSNTEFDGLQ